MKKYHSGSKGQANMPQEVSMKDWSRPKTAAPEIYDDSKEGIDHFATQNASKLKGGMLNPKKK